MKKILSFALAVMLAFTLAAPAFAVDSTETTVERIDLENGDYIIVTTRVSSEGARALYRDAVKTHEYTSGGKVLWTYSLMATFAFDGTVAKAVSSSDTYGIYDADWSCASRNTRCSGASAYGYGYFKTGTSGYAANLTLTCSPGGKVS